MLIFAGLPFEYNSKLYNVAAAINNGRILGLVPKKYLPNYGEFYERRQFTPGFDKFCPILSFSDCLIACRTVYQHSSTMKCQLRAWWVRCP